MNDQATSFSPHSDEVAQVAARWVMRLDRGLSPKEQDEYLQWLAADPSHGAAMARHRRTWEAFDRLAGLQSSVEAVPDPDLLRPRASDRLCERGASAPRTASATAWQWAAWFLAPLAAAAALAVLFWPHPEPPATSSARTVAFANVQLPPIEERTLEDGSTIRLNRGAKVTVDYSSIARQVRLERGEAAFTVVKDAARPFVVLAAGVAVRAVGTAFNVQLGTQAVDVIVTEGRVAVAGPGALPSEVIPIVAAGQQAVVRLEPAAGPPAVTTPPPEEMSRRLAWQPRLLTFTDEPLPAILEAFNRHNPVILRIDDVSLQELRLSVRFRSDNVPGFLRLLESEFRVRAQPDGAGAIVLRAAH